MVPDGWDNKLVKEITTWKSGGTPSMRINSYWSGNIPWVSASTMQGHAFETSTKFITKEGLESGSKLALKNSLLLLVRGSMLWNKIPVGIAKKDLAFNQDVKSITANSVLLPIFLLYWFLANENKLLHMVTGTGIGAGKLDTNELLSLKLALPPLPEQKKIAKILSTWDQAIEVTEKQITNSQQQKKSLMQQLLTGKKRLPGFSGVWNNSELGKVIDIGRGFAFKSDEYSEVGQKIVRVTNINSDGKIDLNVNCVFIPESKACVYEKYRLLDNDVLIVMVGATAGKLGYVTTDMLPALLNQNMWVLRTKNTNNLCQLFFKYVAQKLVNKYLNEQQGSARGFFTQSTFVKVKLFLPPLEEQQKIASVLSSADKEIEILGQKLEYLRQEKKALMQQLLTGKRRVKIDKEAA